MRTCLDDISANILDASINLLPDKCGRHDMNVSHAEGVLRGESRGGREGVAAMCGDDFLVCFEAADKI